MSQRSYTPTPLMPERRSQARSCTRTTTPSSFHSFLACLQFIPKWTASSRPKVARSWASPPQLGCQLTQGLGRSCLAPEQFAALHAK